MNRYFGICSVMVGMLIPPSAFSAEALPDLIEGVLAVHPSLRSQRALGESAKEAVSTAQWQFYPTPSVGFERLASTSSNDLSYPASGDKSVTTLRLQQPLWTGGRLTAGLEKAQAGELLSQARVEETRQDLALRALQLYSDWHSASLKLAAYRKSLRAHQLLQDQIVRRIAGGASPPSDLTLLQGRGLQTDADLSASLAQESAALARMGQLLKRSVDSQTLAANLSAAQALDRPLEDLLEQSRTKNPTTAKLQAQARIIEAEMAERKADLMPEAYLRAERQYGDFALSGVPSQDRLFVGFSSRFGAGLSSISLVKSAMARYESALADIESSQSGIAELIQADYAQAKAGESRLAALEASRDSSQKIAQAWNRQFIAGRKTWLDLVNAIREITQIEVQISEARSSQFLLSWRLAIHADGLDAALNRGKHALTETGHAAPPPGPEDESLYSSNEGEGLVLQLRMASEESAPRVLASQGRPQVEHPSTAPESVW